MYRTRIHNLQVLGNKVECAHIMTCARVFQYYVACMPAIHNSQNHHAAPTNITAWQINPIKIKLTQSTAAAKNVRNQSD